jgi:hypothetical protein
MRDRGDRRVSRLRQPICWMAIMCTVWGMGVVQAVAHQRDFPFTYDWFQPSPGEKEIEPGTHWRPGGGSFEQQIEFEYGVNRRFMVAPYLVFNRAAGQELRYSAFKVETRWQLGNFADGRILPGLYLEYEQPSGEAGEMEGKVILSRYDRSGGDLSLNLVTEQTLKSGIPIRATYSFGYARPLGASRFRPRAGLECVRDIDEGRVDIGPVLGFSPGGATWMVAGCGFPVSHGNRGGPDLRLLMEYEWR